MTILPSTQIQSFGVIAYSFNNSRRNYLLCQRRHTIEYTAIIRGAYTRSILCKYISLLTSGERIMLREKSFDELWNEYWVVKDVAFRYDTKARNKFYKNRDIIYDYIDRYRFPDRELPWEFPKGKKNAFETDLECAMREFTEESNLPIKVENISTKLPRYREKFRGTNNLEYSTIYYIAYIPNNSLIEQSLTQLEMKKRKWFTFEEAISCLPLHRQHLLNMIESKLIHEEASDTQHNKDFDNYDHEKLDTNLGQIQYD